MPSLKTNYISHSPRACRCNHRTKFWHVNDSELWALQAGCLQGTDSAKVHFFLTSHSIYLFLVVSEESGSGSVVSDFLQPHRQYSPWNSPGQNTGVGSCALLQEIFPPQGLNPRLPHFRQILYQLSHHGSPGILEQVAYSFSSGSSPPRNQTRVFRIEGRFFTS